jgi:hypothetical protein
MLLASICSHRARIKLGIDSKAHGVFLESMLCHMCLGAKDPALLNQGDIDLYMRAKINAVRAWCSLNNA